MPLTTTAAQLIYANVEREQSPKRQRGLQTLYYTRKDERDRLTPPEVLNMETRLSHEVRRHGGERHVYFRTKAGRFALIRFLPLAEADKFDRTGRYFAHALIFRPEAFADLACNPFAAFDAPCRPFAASLDQGIALGDFATGDIPPVTLECPGSSAEASPPAPWGEGLAPSALSWLVLAASQGRKLLDMRRVVALRGESPEVFAFLRGLFAWLPVELRQSCTFDTAASEQTAEKPGQWAAGLAEAPARRSTRLLLLPLRGEDFMPTVPLNPESPFDRWAVEDDGNPPALRLSRAQTAYDLMIASKEADPSKIHPGMAEVIDGFRAANTRDFEENLGEHLRRVIEVAPPAWLIEQARRWMAGPGDAEERARAWVGGPSIDRVISWVARHLAKAPRDFKGLDLTSLVEKDCQRDGAVSQLLVIARDRSNQDWGDLRATMSELAESPTAYWEALGRWLIRSAAKTINLGIHQVPEAVTFGFLVRGFSPGSRAASQVVGILGKGVVRSEELIPGDSIFKNSVSVADGLSGRWLREVSAIVQNMKALVGLGWRFLPAEDGCFFGMDYEPPPEMVGNIENYLARFDAPAVCREKVNLLIPLSDGKKKRPAESPDGEVYPIDDPDCLRLFKLLLRLVRPS